jgi:hypothetical protein
MFNSKKNNKIDKFRLLINDILIEKNIKFTDKERDFYLFLLNDDFNMFNIWFNICSAKKYFKNYRGELEKLLDIFNKSYNIISFKKLFEIDKEWYPFYDTSATIEGELLPDEKRLGVDKKYAMDIIKIKNKCNIPISNAIDIYIKIKIKNFIGQNV